MPMSSKVTATAGEVHPIPFVGPVNHTAPVRVPAGLAGFSAAEIDQYGYLKPGVILQRNGSLVGAAAGPAGYGLVVEATKVADSNSAADLAAAGATTVIVAVICAANRAILEDSLGRVLTAGEIASFNVAGSGQVVLIS